MKNKISFLLIALLSCVYLFAQEKNSGGIQFEHIPLQEALELALEQDKIVFVDAYTSWCGPCKRMAKEVFPDAVVGSFFNAHFVNLKIDMEKGEGPEIAKTYGVRSYPTYLFLDPSGALIHKASGYRRPQAFIDYGEEALSPAKHIQMLEKRMAQEESDDRYVLYKYAMNLHKLQDPKAFEIADRFLGVSDDHKDEYYLNLVYSLANDRSSSMFQELLSNRKLFEERYGEVDVQSKIYDALDDYLMQHIYTLSPEQAEEEFSQEFANREVADLLTRYTILYGFLHKQEQTIIQAADNAVSSKTFRDGDILTKVAQYYLDDESSDTHLLKKAVNWAEKSVALNPRTNSLITLGRLYMKTEDKSAAQTVLQQALDNPHIDIQSAEEVQALLDSL